MDDSDNYEGKQIIPKKCKVIEDQQPVSKKHKRNNRKKNNKQEAEKLVDDEDQQPNRSRKAKLKNDEYQGVLTQLCTLLPEHHPQTIQKFLKANNFDKQKTMNELLDYPPEEPNLELPLELNKDNSSDTKSTTHEIGQKILNEICQNSKDTEIQLDGKEFDELFEQIAELIKTDQKAKGSSNLDINTFLDDCMSVKETLLVGLKEEFSNFDDEVEIDETDPLYKQTEEFIWDLTVKSAKEGITNDEDFPTLGKNKKPGKNQQQKTILEKIQDSYEEQAYNSPQNQFFVQSERLIPTYHKNKFIEHGIFNVDNKERSYTDMKLLKQEFENVSIQSLKFIYRRFYGDFNLCRSFLEKYYKDSKQIGIKEHKKSSSPVRHKPKTAFQQLRHKESIDDDLKEMSYQEIRSELEHLFKLRQVFNMTKGRIQNKKEKMQLDQLGNANAPIIRKLIIASRVKVIKICQNKNPLFIDLHGYREEEVSPLLEEMVYMIKAQFHRNPDKVEVKKRGGRTEAMLTVLTGKGKNSKYGISVLKPVVEKWCDANGLRSNTNDDNISVFISVL